MVFGELVPASSLAGSRRCWRP